MVYPEPAYWLSLLSTQKLDRTATKRALYRFTVAEGRPLSECAGLPLSSLLDLLPDLQESDAAGWVEALASAPVAAQQVQQWQSLGVHLITRADASYPESLAQRLPEPWLPYLLFARGNLELLDRPTVCTTGAESPDEEASRCAHELAEALAELPLVCLGGYSQGVDRRVLTDVSIAGGSTILLLPIGLAHAASILRAGQQAVDRGIRLELSPYLPDAAYTPALGRARNRLILAMADAMLFIGPAALTGDWPGLAEACTQGTLLLSWKHDLSGIGGAESSPALETFRDAQEAAARIARHLALGEDAQQPDTLVETVDGAAIHFDDADSAITQLQRSGHVPAGLMRRLRDAEREGRLGGSRP